MKNKIIIPLILIIVIVIGLFIFIDKKENHQSSASLPETQEKIKIAACPTCYELSKKLDLEKYQVIKTSSTAQSIALLESGRADMILAGRTLKPNEPQMDYLLIDDGYSFLSNQEITIFVDQLNDYNIYTDLDEKKLKQKFPIAKIQTVDNVYEYLDKGIIITSWENTNYNQAEIIRSIRGK
ncbi:MAG: hypothetical protein U5L10_05965 [Candidatus Moranbacteria bacterium]|nr:hypothetical protein [Candidatus Moranbacteria bacterium]